MDIDGGNAKQIVSLSDDTFPQCSPDGRWVVYDSVGSGRWPTLWKAPVGGGDPVQLNDAFSAHPAISADGRTVACFYAAERGSQQVSPTRIAILPVDGGPARRIFDLTNTVFQEAGIRWQPDGSAFTYVDSRDGISNIWSQPLDGSPARQLTDFKGDRIFHFDWSSDGNQLVFSRGARTYDVVLIRDLK
jgi:Tol biopolymer transport system component